MNLKFKNKIKIVDELMLNLVSYVLQGLFHNMYLRCVLGLS